MQEQHSVILQLTNDLDHENECNNTKQLQGMHISSQGRYTITLTRYPKQHLPQSEVLQFISEQYGIQESDYEIANLSQQEIQCVSPGASTDLQNIFGFAKINISGAVCQFKQSQSMGEIDGGRVLVNDGNTILLHFTDALNNYILFHEIKF